MPEGYLDATEGGDVSGLLGEVDDLGGILDLGFITDVSLPNESGTTVGGQEPHQYQIAFDKLGKMAKAGLTYGATAGLYGINPLLAVAAHTPGSFFRAGAKKLGGGDLDNWDKADLYTGFISATPLSSLVNRFVDIVFPGSTTLDED